MPNIRASMVLTLLASLLVITGCDDKPPAAEQDRIHQQDQIQEPPTVRRARLTVPRGSTGPFLEFVSRKVGYALFTRCETEGGECLATLFGTEDGGITWHALPHPRPRSTNHQLYATPNELLLLAEPDFWFRSRDHGRSFTATDGAIAPYRLYSDFFRTDGDPRIQRWAGDTHVPIPAQPPLPNVDLVTYGADGRLWAASLIDGTPRVALSVDQGASWRETPVAGLPPEGAAQGMLQLRISADGADAWMVISADRFAFPRIWQFGDGGWLPIAVAGNPENHLSLAAVGDGALAVTGPSGIGAVRGGFYRALDWPLRDDWITVLPDGTIFSRADEGGTAWLGTGTGLRRSWTQVVIEFA